MFVVGSCGGVVDCGVGKKDWSNNDMGRSPESCLGIGSESKRGVFALIATVPFGRCCKRYVVSVH